MFSSSTARPHVVLSWRSNLPRGGSARPPAPFWGWQAKPSAVRRLSRPGCAARPALGDGLPPCAASNTREVEGTCQQQASACWLTKPDWRWVKSLELGTQSYAEKEAELLSWLEHNGPSLPCNIQLGLACLRGGRLDLDATIRLHAAVYKALRDRLQGLSIHIQRPELCGVAGLLPAPSQAAALESLHLWISPAVDKAGRMRGKLTLTMLEGLRQFAALKDLSIWCPPMSLGMEELIQHLPPGLVSLSLTHESRGQTVPHRGSAARAPPHALSLPPVRSSVDLLQKRARLEYMLTLDIPDEEGEEEEGGGGFPRGASGLTNLSRLQRLRLSGVDLSSGGRAWHWLGALTFLEELELANSPLEELPPLPLLRTLRLHDSAPSDSLDALPRGAGALPALEELSISTQSVCGHGRNVSLRGLEGTLRSLSVVGAGLYVIPPDLAACIGLTSLRLGYTDSDSARHANLDLQTLQALEVLSVSYALPRGLGFLPRLSHLSLHNVDLSGACSDGILPTLATTWQRLAPPNLAPLAPVAELAGLVHECEEVEDGSCVLLEVPLHPVSRALQATPPPPAPSDRLPPLCTLRSLTLRDCTLGEAWPGGLEGLEELSLHGGEGPPPPLPRLPHLARLSLIACKLRRLPQGLRELSATLESLDLSGNAALGLQQQAPAPALPPLPALRRLALSDCGLGDLPDGLEACLSLETLELNSNLGLQGASLPALPVLRRLSLQDCGLFELPAGVTSLPQLQSLDLRGNFSCEISAEEEAWLEERFGGVVLDWASVE